MVKEFIVAGVGRVFQGVEYPSVGRRVRLGIGSMYGLWLMV